LEKKDMALHSNLRDYQFGNDAEDIRGASVYGANGEKLGEIDDVIFDTRTGDVRYVVVDTGGWLTTVKFVVPARQLMTREEEDNNFRVNLTKEQVQRLPEYNEEDLQSEDRWSNYESRYEAAWVEDPVLHRAGSTHTVTPDPDEEPPAPSGIEFKNATPRRIAHDLPRFGATSNTEDATAEGNLAGEIDLQPVSGEYTGVDAVIPLQASEEEVVVVRKGKEKRTPGADTTSSSTEGGRRFREFQDRLRKERDQILRKRREKAA
jgi:sporulation protein YlmC with PRC-barrel domain